MLRRPVPFSISVCFVAMFSLLVTPLLAASGSTELAKANQSIIDIAQSALAYAAILAAASTVSMAFVELLKALTDLRSRFQQSALNNWLGSKKAESLPELLYLAIGDRAHESVLC